MAFSTRCPECNAKLKFDAAPEPDEAVECPRCGHVFEGADAKPIKKRAKVAVGGGDDDEPRRKKKKGDKKPAEFKRKVRRAKKKKSNPVFLWMMILSTLVVVPTLGYIFYKLNYSKGKLADVMAYVPGDCNLMRGCDLERLRNYKGQGFIDQVKIAMSGPLSDIRDDVAKAAGKPPEEFLSYAMQAKLRDGGKSGTMFVFMSLEDFDSAAVAKSLGGVVQNVDGQEVFRMPGSKTGAMANATVYFPAPRVFVVISADGDSSRMLKASIAAKNDVPNKSMLPKLGATGNKCCRAQIWTLMIANGDFKGRIQEEIGDKLKNAYSALSNQLNKATMFGTWIYFGTMIKYGAGIELDSEETAADLQKTMSTGPLSKGDDSEIANDMKLLFPVVRTKEFAEFMANLDFKYVKTCAYLESRMTLEKSIQVLSYFNRPPMWEGDQGESGGGRRR